MTRDPETGKKIRRVMEHQSSRMKQPITANEAMVYFLLCMAVLLAVAVGVHQYYHCAPKIQNPNTWKEVRGAAKYEARQWLAGNRGE